MTGFSTRRDECGQALVESVIVIPVLIVCAMAMLDAGVLIRDRMALTHAVSAAIGSSDDAPIRRSLPATLHDVQIERRDDQITISARSTPALTGRIAAVAMSSYVDLAIQDGEPA